MEVVPCSCQGEGLEGVEDRVLSFKKCRKYRNHDTVFIPTRNLTLEQIPEEFRDSEVLYFVRWASARTVRLVVGYTSSDRPEHFRNNAGKLTGYQCTSYGSGHIFRTGTTKEEVSRRPPAVGIAGRTFFISTAAHVVFNDKEAENTKVEFFFDDDEDRSGVIIARGSRIVKQHIDLDFTTFTCVVETESDGDRIRKSLQNKVGKIPKFPFLYCVSHPHGTAKKVSFGSFKIMRRPEVKEKFADWEYLLKILTFECKSLNIDEEKVFYFFTQYFVHLYITTEILNQSFPLSLIEELLKYLQTKGLICKCSLDEYDHISNIQDALINRFNHQAEGLAATDGRFDLMEPEEKVQIISQLRQQCLKNESSKYQVNVSNIFRTIVHGILKIIGYSKFDILNYCPVPMHFSCTYSIPTCPASSGSHVLGVSYIGETGWLYYGTHTGKATWKTNQSKHGSLTPICEMYSGQRIFESIEKF